MIPFSNSRTMTSPSSVLAAALGVGAALVIVLTVLICRYYLNRRRCKDEPKMWSRWPALAWPFANYKKVKSDNSATLISQPQEFCVSKEHLTVQPCSPIRPSSPISPTPSRPRSPLLLPSPLGNRTFEELGSTCRLNNGAENFDPRIGTLQPDLYKKKDTVVHQGLEGADKPGLGKLHFRLKYDFDKSDFVVHLIEAHDLPSVNFGDPYVKIWLHPDIDNKIRQTAVHRKTLNPLFNEIFKFPITHEELMDKTLHFQFYDYDKFSRNDVIGDVKVVMSTVDVTSDLEVWCEIQKVAKAGDDLGELLFSLSYLPSAERLTVVIMKAKNLKIENEAGTSDPFVRVSLNLSEKVKKKNTTVRKNTVNPVWNEALTFNVPSNKLSHATLELSVMDHDIIVNSDIGSCIIGPNQTGKGLTHWNDMMQNMRKAVAMWHSLHK